MEADGKVGPLSKAAAADVDANGYLLSVKAKK
jgi:hypothetical protein